MWAVKHEKLPARTLPPIHGGGDIKVFAKGAQSRGTPSVIFISGLGDSHESWVYTSEASEAAKRQWALTLPNTGIQGPVSAVTRTMSVDWPGSGESPPWGDMQQPDSLEEEAAVIIQKAKGAGLRPLHVVVAHSFGCHVALALRGRYRGLIKGLILIDPPPYSAYASWPKNMDESTSKRITAGARSILGFDRKEIFEADDIVVHVDIVPEDAPEKLVAQNRANLKEYDTMFKRVIRHHGASHHIHFKEPRSIVQSILTMVQA